MQIFIFKNLYLTINDDIFVVSNKSYTNVQRIRQFVTVKIYKKSEKCKL